MSRFFTESRHGGSRQSSAVLAIVQARMGSMRLPGKVLLPLGETTVLELLLTRLRKSRQINEIVLAVPESPRNDVLISAGKRLGVTVRTGPDEDVFERFTKVVEEFAPEYIVRITADCPLVDARWIDALISEVKISDADYGWLGPDFPDGLDAECFSALMFERLGGLSLTAEEREHVTLRAWREAGITKICLDPPFSEGGLRLTLDEPEDYKVLQAICDHVEPQEVTAEELILLHEKHPDLFQENTIHLRNEGATMSKGQKLWKRAERVIAGGNMLLSKHPKQFGARDWPVYYEKARGVGVTDLDGRNYLDFGLMGVGTNILGYGHPVVDESVRKAVALGNMSSLNCKEEVLLAEELIRIHPWSQKVRFTRAGGEAGALAVRIARAATGKSGIAVCGYHGWHDWYLAANLETPDSIGEMHLPGLGSAGIPDGLAGTTTTFTFNSLESLRAKFSTHNLGAVVMEVQRNEAPEPGFLQGVRDLCDQYGAALIFDECSSGFRNNLGGLHMVHNVNPDICILGKTLGNGYAINAVLGTDSVMGAISKTFVSSTFWSERIGPVAALAALRVMEEEDAPKRIMAIGHDIRRIWSEAGQAYGLGVESFGLPALSNFQIEGFSQPILKSILIDQFLRRGFLAGPYFFASIAHTESLVSEYEDAVHGIFALLAEAFESGNVAKLLDGDPAELGIKRIN